MLNAVVMAGGSGTRLWPESRRERPKQLLALQDNRSMLDVTLQRVGSVVPADNIFIATTEKLAGTIMQQMPAIPRESIIAEPMPRNTAPCIGLAAIRVLHADPDATMLVLPSDHVIEPTSEFRRAVEAAVKIVDEDPRRLVTFGIRPTYPSTSFGYIERDMPLESQALADSGNLAAKTWTVSCFREKPDLQTAREYLETGRFTWNAGIFIWKARTLIDMLHRFEPEMHERLMTIAEAIAVDNFDEVLHREFEAMKSISIDYAVMERATEEQTAEVIVIEAPFTWDDVGGWRSLERLQKLDENGNLFDSPQYIAIDAKDTTLRSRNPNRMIALLGTENLIVIETDDALLIADKNHEESVRRVIEELKSRGLDAYL